MEYQAKTTVKLYMALGANWLIFRDRAARDKDRF